MKSRHQDSPEYTRFSELLKRIVRVPHSEIKAKLDAEKQAKQKPKISASRHVSDEKD